jgi:hypothetical protein
MLLIKIRAKVRAKLRMNSNYNVRILLHLIESFSGPFTYCKEENNQELFFTATCLLIKIKAISKLLTFIKLSKKLLWSWPTFKFFNSLSLKK